jgi:hypothetical protein
MRSAGVDPTKPFEFGAMKAEFASSIPWKSGNVLVRTTPLYRAVVKLMGW